MKVQNHKYFLIPEKILKDFDAINSFVREKNITGFNADNLREVINIVAVHERKDEAATPLKMAYLKMLVPNGDRYLLALIEMGVIIRSGNYIPGVKAYNYDFSPDYKSRYTSSIPLTDMRLTRRLNEVQAQFERQGSKLVHGYGNQVQYLKKLTLADGYEKFINDNYSSELEKYNAIMAGAIRIKNRDLFWTIDQTSGRFHSNVTNMCKGLRPFVRVDGKPLCNVDIKNSQPFLSTILLTYPGKVSWLTENAAFALFLESLKVSINQDVKKYISLVVSGAIYEYLMSEFAEEGVVLTRAETKVQMLRILFARNRSPKDETNKKCRAIFKDRFPTVHHIFAKVRGNEAGDKFTSFSRFAILLQRIESYLILDRILKRVYRELPGVVAITIHDSVMTGVLTSDVEAVRKIMLEEMIDFVGFEPQISIEGIMEEEEGIRRQAVSLTTTLRKPLQLTEHEAYN